MTSITIPNSITSIGTLAFRYCDKLEYNYSDFVRYLGNSENPYVAAIEFEKRVLDFITPSITLNSDCKIIANRVFWNCSSLTSVTIPDGMTTIGDEAFADCTGLQEIVVLAEEPPFISENTFQNVSRKMPVYVPEESLAIYQVVAYWSELNLIGRAGMGVEEVTIDGLQVMDGTLRMDTPCAIVVYTTSGICLFNGFTDYLSLPAAGIYIVRCGNKVQKIDVPTL
ncbi:MAG: leucine-rich repeat domain-containing protein [Paludibacter sp.]|nr:leucine-rich repeat domain-containing protein [Bacteroidales bacterium]MCM1068988.1 leucine-rich repeat domain-containing protein [Prevotella sp.]MCM1353651.1 leucine-rich repeat domain-containing protein [Bacteroides sp.]MCM1442000.1 leucine-rich repeat domain-containing protein [Muribaculum sp.]MCM1481544.1 leucine-rich repeat domain-containing protein [Paludibacter sp.]